MKTAFTALTFAACLTAPSLPAAAATKCLKMDKDGTVGRLIEGLCECTKLTENSVQRLQCYDDLAKVMDSDLDRSRRLVEWILTQPGGDFILKEYMD